MHIKIKLFKSYCSSIYGTELWSLEDDVFQDFCYSWRTALWRLLNLLFNAHCFSFLDLKLTCARSLYQRVRVASADGVIKINYMDNRWISGYGFPIALIDQFCDKQLIDRSC